MKLLLFDIDGTLVKTYGSGRRAVEESLSRAFQHPVSTQGIDFGGKTDRQIFREVLLANGLPDSSENIETAASVYTKALYTALPEGRFEVLKGVFPLLEALQKREDVTLSLLTGNIEEMAWLKLKHGGLDHYFEFGAFGSDSEHRNELPHYAFKKAQKRGIEPVETWIIGDTPKDIECAKVGNCKCIAVATGHFSEADLSQHEPEFTLADLSDTTAVLQALNL